MKNYLNYVPILKWKRGEQNALATLSTTTKSNLTPLIEVAPMDWDFVNDQYKKTIDEHLNNYGESISNCWNDNRPLFLDLLWIDPNERMANGDHPLTHILNDCRNNGVNIIPVTGTDRDIDYQNAVRNAYYQDGLGICLRLVDNDFEDIQNNIDNTLSPLGITPDKVDLLIDYKYTNPSIKSRTIIFLSGLLNNIPYINEWRNIILAGTSMPENLSDISTNTIDEIERAEWIIWNRFYNQQIKVNRLPVFGDYAIAHPEPFTADPRLIRMSANIRYTAEDKFIIFKGTQLRKTGSSQYHNLATQLINHPEYSGQTFSSGDQYIYDVANMQDGPGNATNWRQAGTNHHLEFIVNSLSNLSAIPSSS